MWQSVGVGIGSAQDFSAAGVGERVTRGCGAAVYHSPVEFGKRRDGVHELLVQHPSRYSQAYRYLGTVLKRNTIRQRPARVFDALPAIFLFCVFLVLSRLVVENGKYPTAYHIFPVNATFSSLIMAFTGSKRGVWVGDMCAVWAHAGFPRPVGEG